MTIAEPRHSIARPLRHLMVSIATSCVLAGTLSAREPSTPPAPATPAPTAPAANPPKTPGAAPTAPAVGVRPGNKKDQPSAAGMVGRDQTISDLQEAHAIAASLVADCERYAKQADEEGQGQVASLLRAVKRSNEIRQRAIGNVIQKLNAQEKAPASPGSSRAKSAENIKALIQTIDEQKDKGIPTYLARAKTEVNRDVSQALRYSREALREQSAMLGEARDNPAQFKGGTKEYYVSRTCGFMVDKLDFQKCPVCLAARDDFEQVK